MSRQDFGANNEQPTLADAASRGMQELRISSEASGDSVSVKASPPPHAATIRGSAMTRKLERLRNAEQQLPGEGVKSWPLLQQHTETKSCGHGTCALVGYCLRQTPKKTFAAQTETKVKAVEAQDLPGAASLTYPIRNVHHVDPHVLKAARECTEATQRSPHANPARRIESISIKDLVIDRTPSEARRFYLRRRYFGKLDKKTLTKRVHSEGGMLMECIEAARKRMKRDEAGQANP
mmetsp:Transcript_9253/g.30891  ORF Transcript_9253/g.30891 Transcript_9253/m.30891 type:complete len:236 (+) Transcript_9253:521-1228(+)